MNVLSLFDGMSCGQLALNRAGVECGNYFASEIDKHAIKVTQSNFPNTIQLGDVKNIKPDSLPSIDLLIGGSPCQGFSTSGNGLNFKHPKSVLFFEYVRLLREYNPKYFLLENVMMKMEYRNIITEYLRCEPIEINSSLVSAQNRSRLYWTNIPIVNQIKDKHIALGNILQNEKVVSSEFYIKNRKRSIAFVIKKYDKFIKDYGYHPVMFNPYNCSEIETKSPTLTSEGSRISVSSTVLVGDSFSEYRQLTPVEWERLQTIPDNYTEILEATHRFNTLGNGWTVDVIAHILKNAR